VGASRRRERSGEVEALAERQAEARAVADPDFAVLGQVLAIEERPEDRLDGAPVVAMDQTVSTLPLADER
jgi:hypothetical protein